MAPARGTPDPRRWIYGGLDLTFAIAQAVLLWLVIPNRLPSAAIHLWALPLALAVMGAGTLWGGRRGWQVAVAAGSVVLLGLVLLILRIIVSSAFLAGVYGAFGQGAAMTGAHARGWRRAKAAMRSSSMREKAAYVRSPNPLPSSAPVK